MSPRRTLRCARHPAPGRYGAAFTLPEVLATMVLIGIVVPVAMAGLSLALVAASHARYTAQAASLGEAKLMELVATGQWMMGVGGGDFSPDWPQYRWTAQMATRDFNAYEIDLQVAWTERGVEQTLNVSTIVYDTTTASDSTGTTGTTGGTQP
jgi:prepilin-type N-terminal cleavage/methylation domain-containing protein